MGLRACVIWGRAPRRVEGKTILVWRGCGSGEIFLARGLEKDLENVARGGAGCEVKRGEGKIARRCMDRGDLCTIWPRFAPK